MSNRINIIDSTRGFLILGMVIYHFMFNLVEFAGINSYLLYNPLVNLIQVIGSSIFIIISGISSNFSKNNLKRGIKILLLALVVTIFTFLFNSNSYVKFGILHFLGVASILYDYIQPKFDKLKLSKMFPIIMIILFIIISNILQNDFETKYLWALGITTTNFSSSDYFPIFPWIFMYFLGVYLGKPIKEKKLPKWFYTFKCKPLSYIGKKSLVIYILHQPILLALQIQL